MTKTCRIGDRVTDPFLGDGTVVEAGVCGKPDWYMVVWYADPPLEYNCGENPCLWWPGMHDNTDTRGETKNERE